MKLTYLDTSAAMKLVIAEAESDALKQELSSDPDRRLVASWLLHTELHCAASRHPESVESRLVAAVLERVDLVDLTRGDLIAAGNQAALRAGDALHLTVALRLGVDEITTYDSNLSAAAERAGLAVLAPA